MKINIVGWFKIQCHKKMHDVIKDNAPSTLTGWGGSLGT